MKYVEHILEFELFAIGKYSLSVYNLLLVVVIFFAVKGINHSVDLLVKKRLQKKGLSDEGRGKSINQLFKYIIYILGFTMAIKSLGIDMEIILGVFAALGLGIGFALQDLFKDLISGIIILFEGNVTVGDILEIDGEVGSVKQIKIRTSIMRTRDGVYIVIPNSLVVNEKVINWTKSSKITRFQVSVGVAYGSDVDLVKGLLLQSVKEHELVSDRPSPMVFFNDFGDSSLQFDIHYWITDTWKTEIIKSDLRFSIDKLFRENGITIPFPQRDVHMIQK
jgi:small-conductance mechanosensitive channel